MARTNIRGTQITDGTVQRQDLDVTTAGSAVVAKIVAGTNVTLSSTGPDAGTGDVTINVSLPGGSTDPNALHLSGGTMTGDLAVASPYSVKTNSFAPLDSSQPIVANGTFAPWTLDWATNASVHGQPRNRVNELNNVFWQADKRFLVSGGHAALFDGNFEAWYILPSGTTTVDIQVAGYGGWPVGGVTYPQGKIYVNFYGSYCVYDSISFQVSGNHGWVDLGTPVNVATRSDYKVLCYTVPSSFNYAKEYQMTIAVPSGQKCWLTELVYVQDRWVKGECEPPYLDKHIWKNTLYGSVAFGGTDGEIGATISYGNSWFGATGGSVGIGTKSPAYRLDVSGNSRFTDAATFGGTATVAGTATFNGSGIFNGTTSFTKPCKYIGNATSMLATYMGGAKASTIQSGLKIKTPYTDPSTSTAISLRIVGRAYGNGGYGRNLDIALETFWYAGGQYWASNAVNNNGGVAPPVYLAWENGQAVVVLDNVGWYYGLYNVYSQGGMDPTIGAWTIVDEGLTSGVASGICTMPYVIHFAPSGIVTGGMDSNFGDKTTNSRVNIFRRDDATQGLLQFFDGNSCCWSFGQASGGASGLYLRSGPAGSVSVWNYTTGKLTHYKGALFNSGLEVSAPGSGKALTIYGNAGNPYTWVYVEGVDTGNNMTLLDLNAGNGVYGTRLMTHGLHTYLTAYTTAAGADLCFNVGTGNNGHGTNYMTLTSGGQLSLHGNMVADSGISGRTLTSTVAAGTAPLAVSSNTLVANLNADLLDGNEASAFAAASHNHDATYLKLGGGTLTGALTCNGDLRTNNPIYSNFSSTWCPGAYFSHASTATDSMWTSAAPVCAFQNTNATSGNFTYVSFIDSNGIVNAALGCKHVDHSAHTGILQIVNHGTDGAYVRTQLELDGTLHQFFNLQVDGAASVAGDLAASGNISMSASKRIKGWTQSRTLNVESPGAAENLTFFYTPKALKLTDCTAVLVGGTSPSVTFQISYGSTRSAAGTNLWSSSQVCNSTGSGTAHSSFSNSSIPAGSWIWFKTSVSNGSPSQISVFLEYAEA